MADAGFSGVKGPEGVVQSRGETRPGEVRQKQPSGKPVAAPEQNRGGQDQRQQDADFGQGKADLVGGEEDRAPGEIENQLQDIDGYLEAFCPGHAPPKRA